MSVVESVRQVAGPALEERNIELIKVDFLKQKGKYHLILTVDKFEGNISLDEISGVSALVGQLVDENDIVKERYLLEVSSPGVERPLYELNDFLRFKGKKAKVVLKEPVEGASSIKGTIQSVEGDVIGLDDEGKKYKVSFENIKRSNLVYDIREDLK